MNYESLNKAWDLYKYKTNSNKNTTNRVVNLPNKHVEIMDSTENSQYISYDYTGYW